MGISAASSLSQHQIDRLLQGPNNFETNMDNPRDASPKTRERMGGDIYDESDVDDGVGSDNQSNHT